MEQIPSFLASHPVYLVGGIILLGVLLFAIFRKLLQLVVVAAILLLGYLGYVTYVSVETQETVSKSLETGKEKMIRVGEKAGKALSD